MFNKIANRRGQPNSPIVPIMPIKVTPKALSKTSTVIVIGAIIIALSAMLVY